MSSRRLLSTHVFLFSGLIFLAACSGTDISVNAPGGGLPVTYSSPDGSFSVRHPDGWGIEENYHLTADTYEANGTALLAPTDRNKSTLYEGIFHVAQMPECPEPDGAGSFLHSVGNIGAVTLTKWSDAAAGNRYEGETYTTETDTGCLVVTFYAHSYNLSPEDCGPTKPQPYDKKALFAIMRQMLETLRIEN